MHEPSSTVAAKSWLIATGEVQPGRAHEPSSAVAVTIKFAAEDAVQPRMRGMHLPLEKVACRGQKRQMHCRG